MLLRPSYVVYQRIIPAVRFQCLCIGIIVQLKTGVTSQLRVNDGRSVRQHQWRLVERLWKRAPSCAVVGLHTSRYLTTT